MNGVLVKCDPPDEKQSIRASASLSVRQEEQLPSLNGAVPECTRRPRRSDHASAGDVAAGCPGRDRAYALRRVSTSTQTVGLCECKDPLIVFTVPSAIPRLCTFAHPAASCKLRGIMDADGRPRAGR